MKRNKLKLNKLLSIVFPVFTVAYLEIILHLLTFKSFGIRSLIPVLFAVPCGLIVYFFSTFFKQKANKIIYSVLISIISIYFIIQFVYYSIFGSFMSLYLIKMGTEAVTNFFDQMLFGISRVIFAIILFIVPLVIMAVLLKKNKLDLTGNSVKTRLLTLPVILLIHVICLGVLAIGGTKAYSPFDIYFDNSIGTNTSVENLGVITTTRLEFTGMLFPDLFSGSSIDIIDIDDAEEEPSNYVKNSEEDKNPAFDPERNEPVDVVIDTPKKTDLYNMLDIDFDALIEKETDRNLLTLHKYFASKEPTRKNEYTGMFRGYNLITICAESFSPYLVSEDLTPTLYKMMNNGFVFTNYFGSFESNTTNGEYTFCMGNFPDFSRDKTNNSFIAAMNNSLPFAMGNVFKREFGTYPYAFHNYYGNYYQRNKTHPNMGYDFISPETGLDIEISWPSSDLEMMEASVDFYLNDPANRPFHAYYMTFSGHYQYNWVNPMSIRNKRLVSGLPYKSETVLAYIACNLELEKALTYLVDRLEEAGVADKTVIVLSNDHYPYGLKSDEYNEMAGKEIDVQFEKYRNSFICWSPSVKEPIIVDTPCCTIDILPTLLNLFGVQYDSRLICGVDVLATNIDHIAILSNQSFITDGVRFSSSNNTVEFTDPSLDEADVNVTSLKNYVKNVFTVSTAILEYNYYSIFDYIFFPVEGQHFADGETTADTSNQAFETDDEIPSSETTVVTDENGGQTPVPTDPTIENG